jgi:hypothetical protein
MAAAASKMATATAAVTAATRHGAGRHRRHAERDGRCDCNDCSPH